MKTLTAIFVMVLVTGSSGFLIRVPDIQQPTVRTSSISWIHMQKLLLPLFDNVCEASRNPTIVRLSNEFTTESVAENYVNPEMYTSLKKLYSTNSQLKRGEIFTEFNQDHMYEFQLLFNVLYSAHNFDTFYKTAAWARQNTNCGLFVNAIYLAILKRRDTEKITVPAPYELLPHYFVRQDIIIKASFILAGADVELTEGIVNEGNAYILDANYTCNGDANDDSKLAYFYEDIGLNTYYYLKRLVYAPWFHSEEMNSNYGEFMYHFMKQLSARYNLERYSNGLTPLDRFDWETCNVDSYDPMLVFSDGEQFTTRQSPDFTSTYYFALKNIEDNIMTVIPTLVQNGYTKSQIINNLMNLLVLNLQNYESDARSFFGDVTVENRSRSVLTHYMTSLRDPILWRINKKIVNMVDGALKTLPGYSRNELYFPGVQVLNIEVKKIMTMFEPFKFEVTDSLKTSTDNPMFDVNLVERRLSHKPFSMKLNVSSLVSQKGLVKIYLGPKILPGEFAVKKDLFMLLDSFECNLKVGSNVITRSSNALERTSEDFVSLKVLRKLVEDAEFGLEVQPLKCLEALSGFPSRLILPKGTPEGLPMQLLIFVAPFTKVTAGGINIIPKTEFNAATLSPGYPFDLDFDDAQFFSLPNVLVKDIAITHKDGNGAPKSEYDGSRTWGSGDATSSYSPKRESYNYNLKKSPYAKDYAAKKDKTPKFNEDIVIDKSRDQSPELNRYVVTDETENQTPKVNVDVIIHKSQDNTPKVNEDLVTDETENGTPKIDADVVIHKSQDKTLGVHEDVMTDKVQLVNNYEVSGKGIINTDEQNVDFSSILYNQPYTLSLRSDPYKKYDYEAKRKEYEAKRSKYANSRGQNIVRDTIPRRVNDDVLPDEVINNYEIRGKGNTNADKPNIDFSSNKYDQPYTLSLRSGPYKKYDYEAKRKDYDAKRSKYAYDKDIVRDTIPKSENNKLEDKQLINKNVDVHIIKIEDEQNNIDAMKSVIGNDPKTGWNENVEEIYKRVIPGNVLASTYNFVTPPLQYDEYIYE